MRDNFICKTVYDLGLRERVSDAEEKRILDYFSYVEGCYECGNDSPMKGLNQQFDKKIIAASINGDKSVLLYNLHDVSGKYLVEVIDNLHPQSNFRNASVAALVTREYGREL